MSERLNDSKSEKTDNHTATDHSIGSKLLADSMPDRSTSKESTSTARPDLATGPSNTASDSLPKLTLTDSGKMDDRSAGHLFDKIQGSATDSSSLMANDSIIKQTPSPPGAPMQNLDISAPPKDDPRNIKSTDAPSAEHLPKYDLDTLKNDNGNTERRSVIDSAKLFKDVNTISFDKSPNSSNSANLAATWERRLPAGIADETHGKEEVSALDLGKALLNAKQNSNGWDSKEPPSTENLKEIIGNSQVIFWGDKHEDQSDSPDRFNSALANLKEAGVDTIAMEGFREDQQTLVNDWLAAKKGSDEEKNLDKRIRDYANEEIKDGHTDKIMSILNGIKDAGMNIMCIERNGEKLTDNGPGQDTSNGREHNRDENWARVVNEHLKDHPDSKIVVFAGATHFFHPPDGGTFSDREKDLVKTVDLTPPSYYQR